MANVTYTVVKGDTLTKIASILIISGTAEEGPKP